MNQPRSPKNSLDWYTKSTPRKNFKVIKPILLQLLNDKKNHFFYKLFFFSPKMMNKKLKNLVSYST